MIKNYLSIALRNLKRQLLYSFINIIGLAVGLACSLVIFFFVYGEWSHDRHFKHADRIYRIGISFFNMGPFGNAPEVLKDHLPKQFGGIETFTAFQKNGDENISVGENSFKDRVYYVDSSFFKVFSYTFAEGDASSSVLNPYSAVLTETMAKKYFKEGAALGKQIEIGKTRMPFTVTAIVKDEKHTSHLDASLWLTSPEHYAPTKQWSSASFYTYVQLREHVSEKDLKGALDQIIAKQIYPASNAATTEVSLEDYLKDENSIKFSVLPLRDIYLKSKASLELSPGGNETNIYIFSIVALFILVLAAVNFINLSTARATRRAKEVGIRKSLGTTRGKLITQFLLESVITSLFSMILALGLAELFTFAFYWITGQQLAISIWASFMSFSGVLIFSVIVGVVAGIYPAFYLTSFQPVKVLKGDLQASGSQSFRNSLVVFQFAISITLIICTTIIIRQLNYMATKDLGFDQENVISIDDLYLLKGGEAVTLKDQLQQQSGVINTSLHAGQPGSKAIIAFYTYKTPEMPSELTINTYFGDYNYLNVMGFKLIKGRGFNKELLSDTAGVILNESAASMLNLREDPIGTEVAKGMKVIGVVSDFHWESLRNTIAPLAIRLQHERTKDVSYSQLALKVNSAAIPSLIKTAESKWKALVPDEPFQYHFLDENFGELVKKEEVLGKAIGFFTVLAILISCLGLFGLAAYTIDQRTKEIGIRKVLGATVANIVLMLNRQFTVLVFVAMLFAIPVSYFAADQWLSGFAYRTDMSIWIFIACSLAGLMISCATVAFHSVKASRTNPAETLKWE